MFEYICRWREAPRRKRFKGREELAPAEIRKQYFPYLADKSDEFEKLWVTVGKIMDIPSEKLRPTDRFDGVLRPVKGFEIDDRIEELSAFFYDLLHEKKKNVEIENLQNLQEAIDAILKE